MRTGVYIKRHYRGYQAAFIRDDLETAWLLLAEERAADEPERRGTVTAVRRLIEDHGWDRAKAIEYVIVASEWDGKD